MSVRAFRVAYDGGAFRGFQRQPHGETVEDALLGALRALGLLEADADTPPGYAAAGRTDAGVSALAQTVAFEAPEWLTPPAFNAELPDAVRVWAHADVPATFHATHDATRRVYTYHLYAPDADLGAARDALETLAGTHDFHNLTPDPAPAERTLEAGLEPDPPFLVCTFAADGFDRQLVRRAVSLVEAVALGDRPPAAVERALGAEPLPGHEGVPPAPPTPLILTDVAYPDVRFLVDPDATTAARERFRERAVARRREARAATTIADRIPDG